MKLRHRRHRRNIISVFSSSITAQQTVSNWFDKCRTGNFNVTNEPHDRPESPVNNDVLKVTVEFDPS